MNSNSIPAFSQKAEPPLLAGLIRSELLEWAKQLQGTFNCLEKMKSAGAIPAALAEELELDKTSHLTQDLAGKMEMLACLAETYGIPDSNHHERFLISSLLSEILAEREDRRWPRFIVKSDSPEIAPVYGNKHWIRTLLKHLLRELEVNMGVTQKIVFSARQLGNHVLLVCHDEALSPHDRNRPRPPLPPPSGLTFSFCRRIAELHGGVVRLDSEEESGKTVLTGFTLSLPTSVEIQSATHRCDECQLVEQIERYAADLASLIDRCDQLEEERKLREQVTDRR